MNDWKLVATIIASVLVLGFILWRTKWKTSQSNLPTNESVVHDKLVNRKHNGYLPSLGQQFDGDNNMNQAKIIQKITEDSENEIISCLERTSDLRQKLLDKAIKASDLVKQSHLVPKGMDYSNPEAKAKPKHTLKLLDFETTLPTSKLGEQTNFTSLPNFFGNSDVHGEGEQMPTCEAWTK